MVVQLEKDVEKVRSISACEQGIDLCKSLQERHWGDNWKTVMDALPLLSRVRKFEGRGGVKIGPG